MKSRNSRDKNSQSHECISNSTNYSYKLEEAIFLHPLTHFFNPPVYFARVLQLFRVSSEIFDHLGNIIEIVVNVTRYPKGFL